MLQKHRQARTSEKKILGGGRETKREKKMKKKRQGEERRTIDGESGLQRERGSAEGPGGGRG